MLPIRIACCVPLAALLGASPALPSDPMRFFEGRTVSDGVLKVIMKKPTPIRTVGQGKIEADGSLTLVQQVTEQGSPQKQRRWRVRRSGPNAYTASMNEAVGPVAIERVGDAYRFRFKMKDQLSVEQWLKPLPGGRAATNSLKVRKFGVIVASSEATIRKV